MRQFAVFALLFVAATCAPATDVTTSVPEVQTVQTVQTKSVTTPTLIPVHVVVVDEPVHVVQQVPEDTKVVTTTDRVIEQIAILHQDSDVLPDGSFHNNWDAENGIKVQEEGTMKQIDEKTMAQSVKGEIAYTDREGRSFVLSYVADETGFHPVGDHLPTPPPIPKAIARGLEWIAAHPPVEETVVEKTAENETDTVESVTKQSE